MEIKNYREVASQIYSELLNLDINDKNLNNSLEKNIYKKVIDLSENNWKRKEVHSLIRDLIDRGLENKIEVYLWDVETAIIGHCDTESIIKFNDDPKELKGEEFRKYVLKNEWN